MTRYEITRDGFTLSDDRDRLDLDVIHEFLSRSYWAEGIRKPRIERAIANSFPFGLYGEDGTQIGFARVLSDLSSIAYLMDVFVLEQYRGRGLGKFIVEGVLDYPKFAPVRRWMLATSDAHELYRQYGFGPYEPVTDIMMKFDPDMYHKLD